MKKLFPISETCKANPEWKCCPHGFKLKRGEGYPKKCPFCKQQREIFKKIGV